jgi:hypothetical protein
MTTAKQRVRDIRALRNAPHALHTYNTTPVPHSGLNTREGKLLRLELQFKDDPVIDLKRADNTVIASLHRWILV